jgi:F-type H+-transporting ATPase subunit gamma
VSDSSGELRQKLNVAADLHGVVRTMKAMAASGIGKYQRAVGALAEYDRVVKLGLAVALREVEWQPTVAISTTAPKQMLNAIVFGSDQGLVGQFNEVIARFAIETLAKLPGSAVIWAVGEHVHGRLADAGLTIKGLLEVPNDVGGIAALVGHLQVQTEPHGISAGQEPLYVFHNRQSRGAVYEPNCQRLLPLDRAWRDTMMACHWPTNRVPEMLANPRIMFRALVREHLFISLYRGCAESLASENASRLAAMQRAEKNIDELTEELTRRFHQVRQASIDEDLFDVVSGFEALN